MPILFRASILLSLLAHFVVFSLFIFYIPVAPEPFKPSFIFLGSILAPQDISTGYSNNNLNARLSFARRFSYIHKELSQNPFFNPIRSKPIIGYRSDRPSEKQVIKTLFSVSLDGEDLRETSSSDILREMGISPAPSVYRPLRFLTR